MKTVTGCKVIGIRAFAARRTKMNWCRIKLEVRRCRDSSDFFSLCALSYAFMLIHLTPVLRQNRVIGWLWEKFLKNDRIP
jgi:hypothetical protein